MPLLFLVQMFRIMDVITVKGQDLVTLLGQAALSLPMIGSIFLYVCAAIGLARALSAMQASGELHAIHSSRRLPALFGAVFTFTAVLAVVVLLLSHFLSPLSLRRYDDWSASVAADLVGRALSPHRFAEVVPGVIVTIGGRQGEGRITGFFADDQRDPLQRRTYSAATAVVGKDDKGYVLQMEDGAIQFMTDEPRFSQISFRRYDLAVELLIERPASNNQTTWSLIEESRQQGYLSDFAIFAVIDRSAEGLRVIGICLLVLGIAGFPSARRRSGFPLELVALAIAFADRGLTTYAPGWLGIFRPAAGALGMTVAGLAVIAYRLWLAQWARWLYLGSVGRPA
jgi:lipopolysaccharide export system permease protein